MIKQNMNIFIERSKFLIFSIAIGCNVAGSAWQ